MAIRLKAILIVLMSAYSLNFYGQGTVEGVVTDGISGESLIGVNIVYAPGQGVVTDIDGHYKVELENGSYTLTYSYVGYVAQTKNIEVNNNKITIDIELGNVELAEVEIVGDLARSRETPVAFSTIHLFLL